MQRIIPTPLTATQGADSRQSLYSAPAPNAVAVTVSMPRSASALAVILPAGPNRMNPPEMAKTAGGHTDNNSAMANCIFAVFGNLAEASANSRDLIHIRLAGHGHFTPSRVSSRSTTASAKASREVVYRLNG